MNANGGMKKMATWQEMGAARREKLRNGTWVNPELKLLRAQEIDQPAFRYPLTRDTSDRRKAAYAQAEADLITARAVS
jgi:hypothetical protein